MTADPHHEPSAARIRSRYIDIATSRRTSASRRVVTGLTLLPSPIDVALPSMQLAGVAGATVNTTQQVGELAGHRLVQHARHQRDDQPARGFCLSTPPDTRTPQSETT